MRLLFCRKFTAKSAGKEFRKLASNWQSQTPKIQWPFTPNTVYISPNTFRAANCQFVQFSSVLSQDVNGSLITESVTYGVYACNDGERKWTADSIPGESLQVNMAENIVISRDDSVNIAQYCLQTVTTKLEMMASVSAWITCSCAVGATWRMRLNDLTTSGPKYRIHTTFHGQLICHFEIIVSRGLVCSTIK